jgi:hypothetical protein
MRARAAPEFIVNEINWSLTPIVPRLFRRLFRLFPFELGVALGTGHKEGFGLVNHEQPGKVQVAPIHQIKRTGFEHKIVQNVDLVGLAVGDVDEAGNVAAQVQQRVQLDGRFGRAKRCPAKHRQAQVDGAGVESVDRRIELYAKRIFDIERPGQADQVLGKVGVDLPRPRGIRIGQRVARDCLATKAHVIQPTCLGTKIDLDIAQGLAVGQLSKGHGKELVQTGEVLDLVLSPVVCHAAAKRVQGQKSHELRKYELALVHSGLRRKSAKNPQFDFRRSNRDQTETLNSASKSLTYDVLM